MTLPLAHELLEITGPSYLADLGLEAVSSQADLRTNAKGQRCHARVVARGAFKTREAHLEEVLA